MEKSIDFSLFGFWFSCSFTSVLFFTWDWQTFAFYFCVSLMSYGRNLEVADRWICFWNPRHNDSMCKVFPLSFLHNITSFPLVFFLHFVRLLLTECWCIFHVACLPFSPQYIVSAPVWFVTCACVQACSSGLCESLLFGRVCVNFLCFHFSYCLFHFCY